MIYSINQYFLTARGINSNLSFIDQFFQKRRFILYKTNKRNTSTESPV